MPRGQYDRSKSKAQRAAEKGEAAPKNTVKKARAPWGSKSKSGVATASFSKASSSTTESYSIIQLSQLRGCFTSPINTGIISKLDALISAKLDQMTPAPTVLVETKKAAQALAPGQQPAPVPAAFNPTAPPNGQA